MNPIKLLQHGILSLGALYLAPVVCLAQDSPPQTFEVLTETIKPGMTAKFEQGVKAVDDYARAHADPVGTQAYEVLTGPNQGQIVVLVPFNWADQDQQPSYAAGVSDVATKSVVPYTSNIVFQLSDLLPQFGMPAAANSPPSKYYSVEQYSIKPDRMGAFLAAVGQITAAERKENPGSNPVSIFEARSGGDANVITVADGYPSFAAFAKRGKSVFDTLRATYGDEAAIAIYRSAEEAVASEQDYLVQYRSDLSYVPNGSAK